MINPYEVQVVVRNGRGGEKTIPAPCCWSDGAVAVAGRWVGLESRPRLSGWSVVHVATGWSMDSLLPEGVAPLDVLALISFAKHLSQATDFSVVTPETLAADPDLRARCRAHAAAWSPKPEGA